MINFKDVDQLNKILQLLPKLKAVVDDYFNKIIIVLGEQQSSEITGGYESEIEELSAYADFFSESA